jgi:hypothetical protein
MTMYKTIEEAAVAVDEMFNAALQNAGCTLVFYLWWWATQLTVQNKCQLVRIVEKTATKKVNGLNNKTKRMVIRPVRNLR